MKNLLKIEISGVSGASYCFCDFGGTKPMTTYMDFEGSEDARIKKCCFEEKALQSAYSSKPEYDLITKLCPNVHVIATFTPTLYTSKNTDFNATYK